MDRVFTMTMRAPVQGWEVSVNVNGENILTIGHNHLSGIDDIDKYADVVRNCARHLLSFIGDGADDGEQGRPDETA